VGIETGLACLFAGTSFAIWCSESAQVPTDRIYLLIIFLHFIIYFTFVPFPVDRCTSVPMALALFTHKVNNFFFLSTPQFSSLPKQMWT
jgi:hypothetical protein